MGKQHARILLPIGAAVAAGAVIGCLLYRKKRMQHKEAAMGQTFEFTSPAFGSGNAMPAKYTCDADNISPPLTFGDVPEDAKSLAIVVHDPDAPVGDYLHWAVWNINPSITAIGEGKVPVGAVQGTNDFSDVGYGGPCPPSGTHRYIFDAYALDSELDLPAGAVRQQVMNAIQAHTIGRAQLIGTYSA